MDAQQIRISLLDDRKKATEHYSFWLTAESMRYIRNASKLSRITQGQILQTMIDYFRLTRKMAAGVTMTPKEVETLNAVKFRINILPL